MQEKLWGALFGFVLAWSASAQTPDGPPLQDLYQRAATHYQQKEYDEALDGFLKIYEITANAEMLFNIAQCYRLLSKPEEAKRYYERFLREAPDSSQRENAQQRLAEIELALREREKAPVTPKSEPAQPPKSHLSRNLFIASAGTGVVAAQLGVTSLIFASQVKQINDALDTNPGGVQASQLDDARDKERLASRLALGADLSLLVAATLGITAFTKRSTITLTTTGAALTLQF